MCVSPHSPFWFCVRPAPRTSSSARSRTPGSSASHQKAYFTENCPRFRLPLSPLTTVRLL